MPDINQTIKDLQNKIDGIANQVRQLFSKKKEDEPVEHRLLLNTGKWPHKDVDFHLDNRHFGRKHLSSTQYTDLTDTGATTLHKHDHGGQDGLSDDDHTQYVLLVGRSGGQTIIGGTASGDDITFQTTSDASKGSYIFSEMSSAGILKNTVAGVVTGGNTITASEVSDFSEAVDDRVNALFVAGSGIGLSYDDGANTFTVSLGSLTGNWDAGSYIITANGMIVDNGGSLIVKSVGDDKNITITHDDTDGFIECSSGTFFIDSGMDAVANDDLFSFRDVNNDVMMLLSTDANYNVLRLYGNNSRDGLIRIFSAGNDKYMNIYHDDTDGRVQSVHGDMMLQPAGTGYSVRSTHNKSHYLGESAKAWDEAYADNWHNVADIPFLDDINDLALINGIEKSDEISPKTGLPLIDDSTLPDIIKSKSQGKHADKDENDKPVPKGEILYSPEGKPYYSMSNMSGLLIGAIKQLSKKIEDLENQINNK